MASFGLKSVDDRVYFRATRKQTLFLVFLCFCLLLIAALLVALLVLLLIAHQSSNQQEISAEVLRSSIFSNIRPERISDNLRAFTKKPHQSGTEANKEVADEIEERWKANGLEDVHQMSYDVLLTYPKWDMPNHVYVVAQDGRVLFNSSGLSPDLIGDDNTPEASIQWLAYSADGTAQGEPVYCNHGTVEDFDRLEQEFKINMKGKIAIMRYGGTFRGDMVYHAYKRGAVGAILYSDPFEAAPDGPDHVFPSATWMPPQGVQRGSTMKFHGDPLSPLLPSKKDFHKERSIDETVTDPETMPQIPVQPLSYADAYQILSRMDGSVVPSDWQGGMNFTYRLGPGFRNGQGQRVRVEVHAKFEVRTIQNVIGYIWGSEHPDEWVLLGNHYDAWVFGSLDPNSGTSILAEVAKGLAETVKSTGWRPKRTIVFCAWDAEEYGLMGSIEFVEEFANILTERAVVYLNLDLISANNSLRVSTVPSLYNVAIEAAKVVKHPTEQNEKRTMFDAWIEHFPSKTDWMPDFPQINVPGGGSDHMSFLNFLGIPVMDLTYIDPSLPGHQYPLYHSRYELPIVNEQLFDQNLTVHKAVGEYWAELGRLFADSPLLPISATTFAHKMVFEYVEDAKGPILDLHSRFSNMTKVAKDQLDNLARNANQFLAQAEEFERRMGSIGTDRANVRLRKLEQCFINPAMGLAREEPAKRHVLFSVSSEDFYAGTTMSAVHKKIRQLVAARTDVERLQRSNELAMEITVVQQAVLCAVNTLRSAV